MANASRRACSPDLSGPLPGLPHRVLHRYLPNEVVARVAAACGVQGYRRIFDPLRTLWAMVTAALAGNVSQEAVTGPMGTQPFD